MNAPMHDVNRKAAPPHPKEPRGPHQRCYRVEAWAMPDAACRDQRQRQLLGSSEVMAGSAEEARLVYLANRPVPPAFLRDRYRVGPLVIIRVASVGGDQ